MFFESFFVLVCTVKQIMRLRLQTFRSIPKRAFEKIETERYKLLLSFAKISSI